MKSKFLLSILCAVFAIAANYAQSSASQTGIAIQGIARDVNNTALVSQNISLKFTLYYKDASSVEQPIYKVTKNLMTDAFGVFSDVIDPTAVNQSVMANNVAYLRIEKGTDIISDEQLSHVPYAISANNGVPTGSIMPFIGTVAPQGWVLCDGKPLPSTAKALLALVGPTAPNLQGMFLRGTGKSPVNSQEGPALKATQGESFKLHNHTASVTDSGHSHDYGDIYHTEKGNNQGVSPTIATPYDRGSNGGTDNDNAGFEMNRNSKSSKTYISVTNSSEGGNETRPVNYGVNYIIKL